ncbi:MAG: siphovirus Gp157 family protein [Bryobacterales bacterium]|nr:siphovirus Gp157 family protein [Bryobacterales bacterium]
MAAALSYTREAESVFDLGERLAALLKDAEQESPGGQLRESARERVADVIEALRHRVVRKAERDPRSLFDLDDRLIELMDLAEDAAEPGGELPQELVDEINHYIEAFRTKVDRVAGYVRWQESIARICGEEVDRLSARKRAAEALVSRLRTMLLAFMMSRGLRKLEGEKASIGMQANSTPSLVIDDPAQIGEEFWERDLRFSKAELREIVSLLPEGETRRRLERTIGRDGWEVHVSSVRAAFANNSPVAGARLVKGHHVRIR